MEDREKIEEVDVQKRCLTACLVALRNAKSDTEKFAALLMVAKGIKAQDCTVNDKRQILEAVGFPFLVRLLRTKEVPGGCSPLVFKSVAVSVLSAVVDDPLLASDKQMFLVLPYLKEIFETALNQQPEEERELLNEMLRDTYSIVSKMVCTSEGGRMLMDVEFQQALVQILDGKPDEEMFVMAQTLLVLLQSHFGAQVWTESKNSFDQYLHILARRISECEDKSLFNLCELTTYILNYMPEKRTYAATSLKPLLEKLSAVITSKIGVGERQTVLALVNQLVVCVGVDCVLPPVLPDHKMFLLILHLTCIDIRLAVENVTEEQVKKCANKLCLHYNTLETMLNFLCQHDESHTLPLQADMFCQAHDALLGAANGIFFFLQQIDNGSLPISLSDPLTVASVRMIAAITSQAFSEVRENVTDLLPFLVKLCKTEVGPAGSFTAKDSVRDCAEKEDTVALADKDGQSEEPLAGSAGDTGISSALQNTHSCTHISDTLTRLNLKQVCGEQSASSLSSSTGARDVRSFDIKDKGETCSSQDTARTCSHSEVCVTQKVDGSAKMTASSSDGHTEEVSKHKNTEVLLHGSQHEPGAQNRGRESVSGKSDSVNGEEMLPRTVEELTKWICRSSEGSGILLPSLEVMKFLLPVFQLVCEEEETKQKFIELCGHTVLVHFVLQRQPVLSTVHGNSHVQSQMVDCQALDVLIQLVMGGEELGQGEPFTPLLDMVLTTVPQLDGVPEYYVYEAFLIAAGLSILRARASQHMNYQKEQISLFYRSVITYVCQAPKGMLKTDAAEKEIGAKYWQDIQDVWVMALENLKVLVSYTPELTDLLLEQEFIQVSAIILKTHQESILKDLPCVEDLVKALAQKDERAKELLKHTSESS